MDRGSLHHWRLWKANNYSKQLMLYSRWQVNRIQ